MTPACESVLINPWEEDISVKLEQEKMLFFHKFIIDIIGV